jgi:hypothetical protein
MISDGFIKLSGISLTAVGTSCLVRLTATLRRFAKVSPSIQRSARCSLLNAKARVAPDFLEKRRCHV